ncbi:acyltransferase [soil metagenome]
MKQYIKPFDTLRFIAAFLVVFYHWLKIYEYDEYINLGRIGVQIFFVLSGFLITSILLVDKEKSLLGKSLASFFIKRTFRIFPLYYLVIFLLIFLPEIQKYLVWYLTYGVNFLLFFEGPQLNYTLHFWTLAVEEQFYLIWPFIILLPPVKYIKNVIIGILALSIGCNVINWLVFDFRATTLMPVQMVALGAGALLAYYSRFDNEKTNLLRKPWALLFVLFYFVYSALMVAPWSNDFIELILTSVFSVIVVANVLTLKEGTFLYKVMTIRPIMFLGAISYGIYVYHLLIKVILSLSEHFAGKFHLSFLKPLIHPTIQNPYLSFGYNFAVLIVVSTLSWYLFEKPFNKLGHKWASKLKKGKQQIGNPNLS